MKNKINKNILRPKFLYNFTSLASFKVILLKREGRNGGRDARRKLARFVNSHGLSFKTKNNNGNTH